MAVCECTVAVGLELCAQWFVSHAQLCVTIMNTEHECTCEVCTLVSASSVKLKKLPDEHHGGFYCTTLVGGTA